MNKLSAKQYEQIGKEFFKFYMENGFGNKSKLDIDYFIYNQLCQMKYINDLTDIKLIEKKINVSAKNIRKFQKMRYKQECFQDEDLIQALKKHLQKYSQNKTTLIRSGNITFSIPSFPIKLFLEDFLKTNNYNYVSLSDKRISLNVNTFCCLLEKLNYDFVNIIRDFTTDENITKTLSKAKNIETQNIIINISNSPINEPKIKWCNILCSLVESTISGLGSLFIKNTLK